MSETQSTLFNRRTEKTGSTQWTRPARFCGLWIAGAFVLLAIVFVVRFLASDPVRRDPEPIKVRTTETEPRRVQRTSSPVFEVSETYYSTIIDNNLFRPLGWIPPRPIEPYRLIGTLLPRSENTPPRAIIQSTTGNQTYIVATGEQLDASTEVVSIQGKAVTLSTNGEQRTLRLNTARWLNTSYTNRHPARKQTSAPTAATATPKTFQRKPTPVPTTTPRGRVLSEWLSPEGHPIRIGDARLKNPEKWRLRRR